LFILINLEIFGLANVGIIVVASHGILPVLIGVMKVGFSVDRDLTIYGHFSII
jgi:hypothetical protein